MNMKKTILRMTAFFGVMASVVAQVPAPPVPAVAATTIAPSAAPSNPLETLTWDGVMKETSPVPGQKTADFIFSVTNNTAAPVVIDHVQTSCGCTVAKLPSQPWVIAPQNGGNISASINLLGKAGTFYKTLTIFNTNQAFTKQLTLKVNMPPAPMNPIMEREKNQQLAQIDHQQVFKGDCAKCHAEPAHDAMGKELYVKACGICHEAHPRASMVPDLHVLKHPADLSFWKMIIAEGKPKTMMPAFSQQNGGPLTPEQIDSLAALMVHEFPQQIYQNPNPPGDKPTMPLPPTIPPVHN
jgi:mono/diheme cytochrome c family protein